ncbi:hypothetical protein AGMMS50293_06160 [Spirochaetia bacterium]|nr:hypothetical protein AGMMS50293_06160 [Spirochaetia bacterium]
MGIIERKERERAERRALIMRCAKEMVSKYGPTAVSMQDIAKAAELSKATLYLYFHSKEALFSEICDESANAFLQYVQSRLTSGLSVIEKLKLYWKCCLEFYGGSTDLFIIFYLRDFVPPSETAPTDPSYMIFYFIKDMLDSGIAEGIFESDINTEFLTRTILSLFSSKVISAAAQPADALHKINFVSEIRSVFNILLRGMAKPEIDRSLLLLPDISE